MAHKAKKSKRFRYALETLLKVRKIREKKAQEALNAAEQRLQEELRKEEALKTLQTLHYQELHDLIASGEIRDVSEINRRKAHLDVLKLKLEEQIEIRKTSEHERDEKKEALVACLKDRKIIEKDREHKREAWRKLMDKESSKFLDDISSMKHAKARIDSPENNV